MVPVNTDENIPNRTTSAWMKLTNGTANIELFFGLITKGRPMIDSPALRQAMNERAEALFNFYSAERRAGACPIVANERMLEFSKRLDEAELRVADDKFNRDLAVIASVISRK